MDAVTRARVSAHLRDVLTRLLERRVRDPRVGGVTVTAVEISGDGSSAKVFYSVLGGEPERTRAQRGLESVAGFLRGEAGRQLRLRNTPALRFFFDPSLATGERIETLLRKLHEEDESQETEGKQTEAHEHNDRGDRNLPDE